MTWRPLPVPGGREPRPVAESLDRVARDLGSAGATALSNVFALWDEVAGPELAGHARPVALREGVLVIAVDDPAWRIQVVYVEADLRRRLAELAQVEIEGVTVRISRS